MSRFKCGVHSPKTNVKKDNPQNERMESILKLFFHGTEEGIGYAKCTHSQHGNGYLRGTFCMIQADLSERLKSVFDISLGPPKTKTLSCSFQRTLSAQKQLPYHPVSCGICKEEPVSTEEKRQDTRQK